MGCENGGRGEEATAIEPSADKSGEEQARGHVSKQAQGWGNRKNSVRHARKRDEGTEVIAAKKKQRTESKTESYPEQTGGGKETGAKRTKGQSRWEERAQNSGIATNGSRPQNVTRRARWPQAEAHSRE